MVADPITLPGGVLRMKRIEDSVPIVEFGMIAKVEPGWIILAVDDPAEDVRVFAGVDELIQAGWAVDGTG
jgi:hypothetical protein